MEEIIELYEELDIQVPLDIQVKAVETYGFILETENMENHFNG